MEREIILSLAYTAPLWLGLLAGLLGRALGK